MDYSCHQVCCLLAPARQISTLLFNFWRVSTLWESCFALVAYRMRNIHVMFVVRSSES